MDKRLESKLCVACADEFSDYPCESSECRLLHAMKNAVEVVRCKDCKHNEDCIRRIQFWGRNPVLELNTTEYHPLDFCSYGERKCNGC